MDNKNYSFHKINSNNHIIKIKNTLLKSKISKPAIFFDRDGVLIEDCYYISDPINVKILPGVKHLLNISNKAGWLNIVVTNQSGISRGFSSWSDYEKVTMQMLNLCGDASPIHGIFANSNLPNQSLPNKSWRKPSPEMILIAADEFNINLSKSILIGDRLSDLIAAKNAGIAKIIHVLTGHGLKEKDLISQYFKNSSKKSHIKTLKNLMNISIDDINNI